MTTTPPGTPPRRHDNILAVGLNRAPGTSGDANGVSAPPAATQPVHGLVRRTSFFRRRNLSTEILGGPGPPTVVTPASKAAEAAAGVPQDGTTSPRAAARDEQAICDAIAKAVKEIADVQQGSALKRLARTLPGAATTPRPSQPYVQMPAHSAHAQSFADLIVVSLPCRRGSRQASRHCHHAAAARRRSRRHPLCVPIECQLGPRHASLMQVFWGRPPTVSTSSGSASSANDSILTSISIEPSPVTPLPAVRSAGANEIPRR